MEKARKKIKTRYIIPTAIIAASFLLDIIARLSTGFSDFYRDHIFGIISAPFVFTSGLIPFSLGEVFIIIGVALLLLGIPAFILMMIFGKSFRRTTAGVTALLVLWIWAYVSIAETLNDGIMNHCTVAAERYLSHKEHTTGEVIELYQKLGYIASELSEQVPRNEHHEFYTTCDIDKEAKAAMKKAAEKYPVLKGYYPTAKPIKFSFIMSQQSLAGVYFPFTLESNYNDDMLKAELPTTMCHEYAHLRGVAREDEAEFFAFIAATGSDNIEFQYAGYLLALEYLRNEIYRIDPELIYCDEVTEATGGHIEADWFRFLPENYWEDNAEKEIISTSTVSAASDKFYDTSLKWNGQKDGIQSYRLVVKLLLDYYFPAEG